MSTRCQIKIFESENEKLGHVMLYHHHDGYPEGVGYDLLDLFWNKDKIKLCIPNDIDRVVNKLIKKENDEYEVTVYNHTDIEYLYEIDVSTGKINCYAVNNWDGDMKKTETICHDSLFKMWKKDRKIVEEPITNEQIKYIHTIINILGWEDTKYRDFLEILYNVNSCKNLNKNQAEILCNIFEQIKEI